MAFAFDTLGYAKRLRAGGVPQDQAETHAEAAREYIMTELATRHDLDVLRREMQTSLELAIDRQSLHLTVRMGVMLAASIAILATIIQLS